jgi:tetratricopeptide (TPR) repeat protein
VAVKEQVMKKLLVVLGMVAVASFGHAGEGEDSGFEIHKAAGTAQLAGNFNKAELLYVRALDSGTLNPLQLAGAHQNLATLYMSLKQFEKALLHFDKALELNPGYAEAYYGRGNVYANTHKCTEAIEDYSLAIQYRPGYFQAYNNRGLCWAELFAYDKAYEDYTLAIVTSGGKYPRAELNRAVVDLKRQTNGLKLKLELTTSGG